MKEKIKGILHSAEVKIAAAGSTAAVALTVAASAEDTAAEAAKASVMTAFETGFQSMATDALTLLAAMVPICLSIAGLVFLARRGVGWFKSLSK